MDPQVVAPLGVYGVTVFILVWILNKLWEDNQAIRKQMHDDQAAMLPALQAAQAAMTTSAEAAQTSVVEIARLAARIER